MANNRQFIEGARFTSFSEFEDAMYAYQKDVRQLFSCKNSSLIKDNPRIEFSSVHYHCRHSGIFKSKGNNIRQTTSQKSQCPAEMKVKAFKNRRYLYIELLKEDHNHDPLEIEAVEVGIADAKKKRAERKKRHRDPDTDDDTDRRRRDTLDPVINDLVNTLLNASPESFDGKVKMLSNVLKRFKESDTGDKQESAAGEKNNEHDMENMAEISESDDLLERNFNPSDSELTDAVEAASAANDAIQDEQNNNAAEENFIHADDRMMLQKSALHLNSDNKQPKAKPITKKCIVRSAAIPDPVDIIPKPAKRQIVSETSGYSAPKKQLERSTAFVAATNSAPKAADRRMSPGTSVDTTAEKCSDLSTDTLAVVENLPNNLEHQSRVKTPAASVAVDIDIPKAAQRRIGPGTSVDSTAKKIPNFSTVTVAEVEDPPEAETRQTNVKTTLPHPHGKGIARLDNVQATTSSKNKGITGGILPESITARMDVSAIKMPEKKPGKGRPKGAANTVIGLRKKPAMDSKTAAKVSKKTTEVSKKIAIQFSLQRDDNKRVDMLKWLSIPDETIEAILNEEYRLSNDHLSLQDLKDSFADDSVDVELLKGYFEKEAFSALVKAIELKKSLDLFTCGTCDEEISGDVVFCDCCLLWFHYTCVNIKRKPRAKQWFCPQCNPKR